ncbi:hypothetical protein TNCV_2924641 [Trichonephila clavipes]|nr:hypothetical protein TNCV_2924641 [Trichonephila clavipes]
MPRKHQTALSRFVCERPYKISLFSPGSEDISRVPPVLFRARLPCPHLNLLGFQRGRGPSGPSSVFGLS